MEQIIAGRFETKTRADAAASLLVQYIDHDDICIFHNNAPGQHAVTQIGGDEEADPGAEGAAESAVSMAVAGGLTGGAIGAIGGPVGALAGAGVGAYVGSLAGAANGLGDRAPTPPWLERRPAGVMLSVRIANALDENRVIDTLRAHGAADIERAQGTWLDGDWQDFNPVEAPNLV